MRRMFRSEKVGSQAAAELEFLADEAGLPPWVGAVDLCDAQPGAHSVAESKSASPANRPMIFPLFMDCENRRLVVFKHLPVAR